MRRLLVAVPLLLLAACGNPTPTQQSPTGTANVPVVSATPATGPLTACASVTKDTPIAQAPKDCAAVWRPYLVSVVPTNDVLVREQMPSSVTVQDHGSGATNPEATAMALNRNSGWYAWAEANHQVEFMQKNIVGPGIITGTEAQVFFGGGVVIQPPCSGYPTSVALWKADDAAKKYLLSKGRFTQGDILLISTYSAPCTVTGTDAAGKQVTIDTVTKPVTVIIGGTITDDPVLGTYLKADVALSCGPDAPQGWCPS